MSSKQAEILFICGSPRAHTSEALLGLIEQGARDVGARSRKFLLSKKHIAPCTGCGYCEKTGICILADKTSKLYANDDYAELLEAMEHADALAVVSPLFFSGPPAQLKALYDRMQPFWSRKYLLGQEPQEKRPAQIFILGGGGDAHGYEPMVTISRSALAVAGFSLEKIQNFIGYKHAQDIAPLPTEKEAETMVYAELARLRKAVVNQREFDQRALAAGGAFARFVSKTPAEQDQHEQDQQADPQTNTPAPICDSLHDDTSSDIKPIKVVNQVDSEFEVLKQTARASKSHKANQAELNAAIVEAVASLAEQDVQSPTDGETDSRDTSVVDNTAQGEHDSLTHNSHASLSADETTPVNNADSSQE